MDPVEEVPEVEEGESAPREESVAPRAGKGESPSSVDTGAKESPTKLPREEGLVKDGRPAPPNHPTAAPIPGKPGYCFNPFNNNTVDVRGIPPGTLVRDPQDEIYDQRFRVPKLPEEEAAPEGE